MIFNGWKVQDHHLFSEHQIHCSGHCRVILFLSALQIEGEPFHKRKRHLNRVGETSTPLYPISVLTVYTIKNALEEPGTSILQKGWISEKHISYSLIFQQAFALCQFVNLF